jgi:hypothetical protein
MSASPNACDTPIPAFCEPKASDDSVLKIDIAHRFLGLRGADPALMGRVSFHHQQQKKGSDDDYTN